MRTVELPEDVVSGLEKGLLWLPEQGMGYSVEAARHNGDAYGASYWRKYEEYAATPLGARLNRIRLDLVRRYIGDGRLLDVGIGCGAFVEARGGVTMGYDVNPLGVAWLEQRDLFMDPYAFLVPSISCWDSLEHVHEPEALLRNVVDLVFTSLPVFADGAHILRSKHYRRDEHVRYWSRDGLIRWMDAQGFECLEHGTPESLVGREDIHSFVFRRTNG